MRGISRFEVGQVPAKPQTFQFYDEDGNEANLNAYTTFEMELLGSNNERVSLTGAEIRSDGASSGRLTIIWPRRADVFSNTGQYLLRFKFTGTDSVDFTETHEIRVTEFGRVNN